MRDVGMGTLDRTRPIPSRRTASHKRHLTKHAGIGDVKCCPQTLGRYAENISGLAVGPSRCPTRRFSIPSRDGLSCCLRCSFS